MTWLQYLLTAVASIAVWELLTYMVNQHYDRLYEAQEALIFKSNDVDYVEPTCQRPPAPKYVSSGPWWDSELEQWCCMIARQVFAVWQDEQWVVVRHLDCMPVVAEMARLSSLEKDEKAEHL